MAIDLSRTNTRIREWGTETETQLRQKIISLGIRHRANSTSPKAAADALSVRFRQRGGLTSQISYSIPRHMIFVHKGVGRGTTIEQVGQTSRVPKPWFNPVIDANIERLGDVVAEELGDAIVNNLLIK